MTRLNKRYKKKTPEIPDESHEWAETETSKIQELIDSFEANERIQQHDFTEQLKNERERERAWYDLELGGAKIAKATISQK